ncbi:MAG: BREX-1 system phosphatase PglZ type B [Planctomycetota bacterium]
MKVVQSLIKSLKKTSAYNPEVQVAPACVLWPDKERQWESAIGLIQESLPELLVLGAYEPKARKGPAIWLRCVLAGRIDEVLVASGSKPILYLPGVSRQDLRAVENCPQELKPLAELQYRGVIWSQANAKDWTILAFLKSDTGGLGLDVSQDQDTKEAMTLALDRLLDLDCKTLNDKRLDKDFFNNLLTGGDPIRDLLQWLDQEETFKTFRTPAQWKAFVEVSKSQFGFNPQKLGVLAGAVKLATQEGVWKAVWDRYCEAPKRYPKIPLQIRKCKAPDDTIFWTSSEESFAAWPQWNDTQEKLLREALNSISHLPAHEARNRLSELEKTHGKRRNTVWADLGECQLARALEHLATLAELTKNNLAAGKVEDLQKGYMDWGWKVDHALMKSLESVDTTGDSQAVSAAIQSVYFPWAEESAKHLQKILNRKKYPGGNCETAKVPAYAGKTCVLFVDGLRFDLGRRLSEILKSQGLEVVEEPAWAALPSVTATAKPAVSPVRDKIRGVEGNIDFEPAVAETKQSLKGGYHLKKLLTDSGWTILDGNSAESSEMKAWCEFGDIDSEGHNRGIKLAKQVPNLLNEIAERIRGILAWGWQSVHVVTDHGWILAPGGLPKIPISSDLTESQWGRCASIKTGAMTDLPQLPWYWNKDHSFALAPGINCFKAGQEYAHGGLSLQECLTLSLKVRDAATSQRSDSFRVTDLSWKGLRCTIVIEGEFKGLTADIRKDAGDEDSSIVVSKKPVKENGTCSVVVEDESLEGSKAFVMLIDDQGNLAAQVETVVGGEKS